MVGLAFLFVLEKMNTNSFFLPITFACNNDEALDAAFGKRRTGVETEHFDIIRKIKYLRSQIKTMISTKYVKGHLDENYNFYKLD